MNGIITEQNYPVEKVWIWKSMLGSILFVIIFAVSFFLFSGESAQMNFYMLFYLGLIPFNLIFTILKRKYFHYAIEDNLITIKQGVLSKQQRHIPYGVIQNIYVKQDLFDRLFSIASLTLENASQSGGQSAESTKVFGIETGNKRSPVETVGFSGNQVSIPGLKKQNAEALKAILLQKIKDNPIDDHQSGL